MRIIPKINITLDEINVATHAIPSYKKNAAIQAIVTNSKEALPGDLFVALQGEKKCGDDFIGEAISRGAYVMSSKLNTADLFVQDTYIALLDLALYYKTKLPSLKKTIAVTGSVGKTTTKNILKDMLSTCFKVHATKENYNNFLGLFHTVLSTPRETEVLIAELGMNHTGEISLLSKALHPDISIITNIGSSHIGNLGSRELIASAKLEILDGMSSLNLIVQKEEALLLSAKGRYTVSLEDTTADTCVIPKHLLPTHSLVDIYTKFGKLSMQKIALPGRHILSAVAFAVEAMILIGIDIKKIEHSLKCLQLTSVRGKFIDIGDFTVYDDTYSSSREAVLSDFDLLSLYKERNRSCVLGDMLELGDFSEEIHKEIGRAAATHGFERIFAFGNYSSFIKAGAIEGGFAEDKIFVNADITNPDYTAKQILDNCVGGEIILFKASHEVHAERILKILTSIIEDKNQKQKGKN